MKIEQLYSRYKDIIPDFNGFLEYAKRPLKKSFRINTLKAKKMTTIWDLFKPGGMESLPTSSSTCPSCLRIFPMCLVVREASSSFRCPHCKDLFETKAFLMEHGTHSVHLSEEDNKYPILVSYKQKITTESP